MNSLNVKRDATPISRICELRTKSPLPADPIMFTGDLGSKPFIGSFPSADIETVVPLSIAEYKHSVNSNDLSF